MLEYHIIHAPVYDTIHIRLSNIYPDSPKDYKTDWAILKNDIACDAQPDPPDYHRWHNDGHPAPKSFPVSATSVCPATFLYKNLEPSLFLSIMIIIRLIHLTLKTLSRRCSIFVDFIYTFEEKYFPKNPQVINRYEQEKDICPRSI